VSQWGEFMLDISFLYTTLSIDENICVVLLFPFLNSISKILFGGGGRRVDL
jgi:hypothetical protein